VNEDAVAHWALCAKKGLLSLMSGLWAGKIISNTCTVKNFSSPCKQIGSGESRLLVLFRYE
jgi:hypothetical protein